MFGQKPQIGPKFFGRKIARSKKRIGHNFFRVSHRLVQDIEYDCENGNIFYDPNDQESQDN